MWYKPGPISYGAPDNWGAAAVIYALLEGLAGIKDKGVAFNRASISPRWETAGVNEVAATAKYEASGGYLSYKYQKIDETKYRIQFTGNADEINLRLLLPSGKSISSVVLNGVEQFIAGTEQVENSTYLTINVNKVGAHEVIVNLS